MRRLRCAFYTRDCYAIVQKWCDFFNSGDQNDMSCSWCVCAHTRESSLLLATFSAVVSERMNRGLIAAAEFRLFPPKTVVLYVDLSVCRSVCLSVCQWDYLKLTTIFFTYKTLVAEDLRQERTRPSQIFAIKRERELSGRSRRMGDKRCTGQTHECVCDSDRSGSLLHSSINAQIITSRRSATRRRRI